MKNVKTGAIKMLTVKIETVITNQIQPKQLRRRIFKSADVIRSKRSRDTGEADCKYAAEIHNIQN